jgi:hypothetical protein
MGWEDRTVERRAVGVVVERHALKSAWATHRWHPGKILPDVPETAPWTLLEEDGAIARFYAGPANIDLVPSETDAYRFNLESREPGVWIVLRRVEDPRAGPDVELRGVSVSPAEAEALTGAGDDVIEPAPMPPEIAAWIADFVSRYHVERQRFARKRNPHVSEGKALAEEQERQKIDDE